MADAYADAAGFAEALRRAGITVAVSSAIDFCQAVAIAGPRDLYWSGRVTLVSRHRDLSVYDQVYADYFGDRPPPEPPFSAHDAGYARFSDLRDDSEPAAEPDGVASSVEILRHKDFAALSEDELQRLSALLEALTLRTTPRQTRRWKPARRGKPDVRRTVRDALRKGGEPTRWHTRVRRTRPRRLVLLIDVSHSMADYARALLVFARASMRSPGQVEVFCFGTRLTRLTATLSTTRPRDVLTRAAAQVLDWDGGTRIGDSVKRFLDDFGHAGMARGAVVVVCSDGLDTGDPALLGAQMARLSRLTHRIIWLNPLSASAGYEPIARGMQAAMPYVDVFASGHDLANLELVGSVLAGAIGPRMPAGG